MADVATAIISGSFAIAGTLGSVWLKDYLERRRQVQVSQPARVHTMAAPTPPAPTAAAFPDSPLRPLLVTGIGFVVGTVSSSLHLIGPLILFDMMLLVVLFLIVDHARAIPRAGGLALFQLEAFSFWAGYVFGWTLVNHGVIRGVTLEDALGCVGCLAVARFLLIAAVRRFSRRSTKS